jgi:hypothetical protein
MACPEEACVLRALHPQWHSAGESTIGKEALARGPPASPRLSRRRPGDAPKDERARWPTSYARGTAADESGRTARSTSLGAIGSPRAGTIAG